MRITYFVLMFLSIIACKNKVKNTDNTIPNSSNKPEIQLLKINKSKASINIDGKANEIIWEKTNWYPIDQVWLGDSISEGDFSGRYKLSWSEDALYVLAEIEDDTLIDIYKDPLERWWDDDCLEIFIDEDNSGGEHQFNHNAFAYHIALDDNVVDMSTKQKGKLYNSHIDSKRVTTNKTSIWEVKISLFDDSYSDEKSNNPEKLKANKKIGFAIAYCDNDHSEERENFIGSIPVEGEDKNRGWIDANIFATLLLVE